MVLILSVRHPGPVYRGAEAAEGLLEAPKETKQRTQRDPKEAPQKGTHTETCTSIHRIYIFPCDVIFLGKTNDLKCPRVFVGVESE